MSKMSFADALDTKLDEVEEPKKLPQGTYLMTVVKPPILGQAGKDGQYDTVDFLFRPIAAQDDVDPDDLKDYGDIAGAIVRQRFMFDTQDENKFKASEWRLRKFINDHLQVDGAGTMSFKQALAATPNHQCLVNVGWRPNPQNPEQIFVEVKKTAPAE